MNIVNNLNSEVVSVKPTWEGMAKMLIVLLQSEKVDNVNYAKEEIIKMGIHLDDLSASLRVTIHLIHVAIHLDDLSSLLQAVAFATLRRQRAEFWRLHLRL